MSIPLPCYEVASPRPSNSGPLPLQDTTCAFLTCFLPTDVHCHQDISTSRAFQGSVNRVAQLRLCVHFLGPQVPALRPAGCISDGGRRFGEETPKGQLGPCHPKYDPMSAPEIRFLPPHLPPMVGGKEPESERKKSDFYRTESARRGGVARSLTWVTLFEAPLLFVSFSFPNETSWRIQWAPVLGESGWTYRRFPVDS